MALSRSNDRQLVRRATQQIGRVSAMHGKRASIDCARTIERIIAPTTFDDYLLWYCLAKRTAAASEEFASDYVVPLKAAAPQSCRDCS
jgi:hypothetical protein